MDTLIKCVVAMGLCGGGLCALRQALNPLTRRLFSARWNRRTAVLALFAFLIPLPLLFSAITTAGGAGPAQVRTVTEPTAAPAERAQDRPAAAAPILILEQAREVQVPRLPVQDELWSVLGSAWLAGALAAAAWQIRRHAVFARLVRENSYAEADPSVLAVFRRARRELGLRKPVELCRCSFLHTPVLVGMARPRVLLPTVDYDPADLSMILRHELTHCRAGDIYCKAAALAVFCLHWFNPLAHLAVWSLGQAQELACDESVIAAGSQGERRRYASVVLEASADCGRVAGGTAAPFATGKLQLRRRLQSIMRPVGGGRVRAVAAVAVLLALCAVAVLLSTLGYLSTTVPEAKEQVEPSEADERVLPLKALEAEEGVEEAREEIPAVPAMSLEDAAAQREAMEYWLQALDPDVYSAIFYESENRMVLLVTDEAAFLRSAAMDEARARGWQFRVQEVAYSKNQIDRAVDLLWSERERFGLTSIGPWPGSDSIGISLSAEDESEAHLRELAAYCGVDNLLVSSALRMLIPDEEYHQAMVDAVLDRLGAYRVDAGLYERIAAALEESENVKAWRQLEQEGALLPEGAQAVFPDIVINERQLAGFAAGEEITTENIVNLYSFDFFTVDETQLIPLGEE